MAGESGAKPPTWYWVAAGASTLWSLIGCFACYTQLSITEAGLAALPAAQQEIWRMMPLWIAVAYAVAVGFGLAGSLSLLLRKAWAQSLFVVSLIAVLIQFGWTFLATPILTTVGPLGSIPFPAFIIIVAALLVWFSGFAAKKGWLL